MLSSLLSSLFVVRTLTFGPPFHSYHLPPNPPPLPKKLLFLQVWIGRVVSDDLILDVTTGRLLYSEQAGYDGTFESCKDQPLSQAGQGKRSK